ncbi:MAG: radical SAM protein [Candidatus Aminicenantes bacterium]|nr:MAG: radical SAM protein [Candidatus Aminicenantes bacterium]
MKIQLFVSPGGYIAERWSKGSLAPPLGLLYIAAVLEKEGYEVSVVPTDILKWGWGQVRREIQDFKPDLIGVTSNTENRFQSFKLIRLAKKALPQALTILGGPHASMASKDCLEHISELDIVVRGEGETTMLELCRSLDKEKDRSSLESVGGISFRFDGQIKTNPPRDPIPDLDSLPFPALHLIPFEKYNFTLEVPGHGKLPAASIISSRGCPFNCNFCATPVNWGRNVRMRSAQNIVSEIESLIQEYGVRVIFFFDDTFNVNPRRVEEICDLIIERGLNIFWKCDVKIDGIDKPLLSKMKKAGLFHLSFGLEAGSERVRNEVINKKINIDDFHHLIQWCHEMDIIPNPFFIFSHPTETWEEAQETIEIIEHYKNKIEASVAVLHIYPGTSLEHTAKECGLFPHNFTWAKKYHSKIITLPEAQGDVPLFQEKLTWAQISELLFRWSQSSGKISIFPKIPRTILKTRSWGDIKRYSIMAYVYLRLKVRGFFKKKTFESFKNN